jgi:formylglycine-generating enzyme required for sulfatase activity
MNRMVVLLVLLSFFFSACDSYQVEQIEVQVPNGVTVPEGMVYIPKGEFVMGHPDDSRTEGGRTVLTDAYFIDLYEVSRGEYQEFNARESFDPKWARFPVVRVTHQDASDYCEKMKKRLPTEAEWEKAARGEDSRKWPWGQYQAHPNTGFSGFQPEPVDKREEWISPYGLYGVGHNAWEWTADWYAYKGQPVAEKNKFKVIRGGLIQTHLSINFSATYFRNWLEPTAAFNFTGFRCARDVS